MTLKELFEEYKAEKIDTKKRLILCDWKTENGFEVSNIKQFEEIITNKNESYILDRQESDKFIVYDYFTMRKVRPYLVVLRHPLMTNAYVKDIPDEIIDVFIRDGVYRYIKVAYGNGINDYVIEYPPDIDATILDKSKKLFPNQFINYDNTSNISLVFTNGNRFTELNTKNFLMYGLQDIYPEMKTKFSLLTLSKKIWSELKAV